MSCVRSMRERDILVATLDNPPLNVMTLQMTGYLDGILAEVEREHEIRALVLTGSGARAFCAGSDIKEFPSVRDDVVKKKLGLENAAFSRLAGLPKPTVAALNGLAYGGGLELAACCDLIVAEAGGRVALPEIKLGVFPASGGTIRVTRRIGEARAKEMMFLGDPIAAETALGWGLINRVVGIGEALPTALAIARELAARPGVALALCKQSIAMAFDRSTQEGIEASLSLSERVFTTADCAEGVRAFFAREQPRFQHR